MFSMNVRNVWIIDFNVGLKDSSHHLHLDLYYYHNQSSLSIIIINFHPILIFCHFCDLFSFFTIIVFFLTLKSLLINFLRKKFYNPTIIFSVGLIYTVFCKVLFGCCRNYTPQLKLAKIPSLNVDKVRSFT